MSTMIYDIDALRRETAVRYADLIFLRDGTLITDPDRLEQIHDNLEMLMAKILRDGSDVTFVMDWAGDIRDAARDSEADGWREFIGQLEDDDIRKLLTEAFNN